MDTSADDGLLPIPPEYLAERAARAVPGDFGRILAKAGTPVAIPGDELPDSWSVAHPAP